MFPGTTERMQYEIEKLAPARSRIKVTAPPERKVFKESNSFLKNTILIK